MENLQQEDTVSADRKERIIFDKNTGKSRKISSVVSRQNFNNTKYGNRNSPIEFVQGNAQTPEEDDEKKKLKKENMSLVSKILEAKKKKAEEACNEEAELTRELHEVLSADAQAGDWIHDFVHSDNPKFEGKSKKERIRMALGAYYAKQRNEEADLEEAFNTPGKNPLKRVWVHGTGYNTHAIYGETHAGETVKVSGGHGYENAKAKAKRLADKHGLSSTSKHGVNFAKATNEEVELTAKGLAEEIVKKSLSRISIDKNLGVKEVPFDGPYTKTPDVVVDKSGAKHTPYSRVRNLARQALAKQAAVKEEVEQIDEKAAEGFEGTVKAMKKHPEIDNPWALSHWMKKKGYKSHVKEEAEFEFEVIQEGTDYNVTITHYVKGEDGNRTSTKHDYVIKNALSRKHAKNIAMNKHSDKVGPLKPGHSFGTDSFATKELTKEEVELNEGKMGQIHADIESHLGKHLADYKANGGAEHFGNQTTKTASHISKLHGIEQKHAQKFVNDYVESRLKESEMTLDELLEEVEQLEESSVRTRDGDIVKAGDDVGYKDGHEKYGKVHKIQGDIVHIKSWDSDRGEHFIHTKHKSQIWKEEAEYISESPIEKTPRKFSGMHDKVEAPGMRTQAEKAALKAAAKRINDRSKQQANEETDMSDKLTYAQFVEQLLEYTPGPGGVTRVQGRSYGAQYHDPEGDDDADDKVKAPAAAPAVKRGRGRPAGSKSGANVKRLSSKGSNGYGYDSTGYKLHLPNSNK